MAAAEIDCCIAAVATAATAAAASPAPLSSTASIAASSNEYHTAHGDDSISLASFYSADDEAPQGWDDADICASDSDDDDDVFYDTLDAEWFARAEAYECANRATKAPRQYAPPEFNQP